MPSSLPLPLPLPLPVTYSSSSERLTHGSSHSNRLSTHSFSNLLFARARTTNLAVLLLASFCCLSIYFNLRSIWHTKPFNPQSALDHPSYPLSSYRTHPTSASFSQFIKLVIVPGHAIYTGAHPNLHNPLDPQEWILEPYQSKHPTSSIGTFINHIRTAIDIVSQDQTALLVYSGGQTRRQANQSTEAASYSRLANQMGLHDKLSLGPLQTTTEDYALDSWTNLVYSVARFKEYTGHYPQQITVVGHSMKSKRFNELHRRAMKWPEKLFQYVGLDPIKSNNYALLSSKEFNELEDIGQKMIEGEKKVYLEFEKDLYGCNLDLIQKRKNRNVHRRFHPYLISCPEMRGLLEWCPTNGIDEYVGMLPWT